MSQHGSKPPSSYFLVIVAQEIISGPKDVEGRGGNTLNYGLSIQHSTEYCFFQRNHFETHFLSKGSLNTTMVQYKLETLCKLPSEIFILCF